MQYKVKLISDKFGCDDFFYHTPAEALAGAARLMESALREYQNDEIYREVVICVGDEPTYAMDIDSNSSTEDEFPHMRAAFTTEVSQ